MTVRIVIFIAHKHVFSETAPVRERAALKVINITFGSFRLRWEYLHISSKRLNVAICITFCVQRLARLALNSL